MKSNKNFTTNTQKSELLKAVVPIYCELEEEKELRGTGFLICVKGFTILVTSGHTFFKPDNTPNYKPNSQHFCILHEEDKIILNFNTTHCLLELNDENSNFNDYAFFILENTSLKKGLDLVDYLLENERTDLIAIGFDPNTETLKEYSRVALKVQETEKMPNNSNNLMISWGESIQGNSGGPILNDTNKVIGMIALGTNPDEGLRQYFIKSDYLIQKLNDFITKLEKQKNRNE